MFNTERRKLYDPSRRTPVASNTLKITVRKIKEEQDAVAVKEYLDAITKAIIDHKPQSALLMMRSFAEGDSKEIFYAEMLHVALLYAVSLSYAQTARQLLNWGADPNGSSDDKSIINTRATPLAEAVRNHDSHMVALILEHPKFSISDLTAQSVIYAAYHNENEVLLKILNKYGEKNPTVDALHIEGKSALMLCVTHAFDLGASTLVAKGALEAFYNVINLDKILLKAFAKKMFLTTKMIVEHKKPGQIKEITNIIYAAIHNKQYDLIPVLLRGEPFNSIDLNTVRFEGRTIIEHAIGLEREQGHSETLKLLIPYMKLPTIGSASTPTATGTTATRLTLWQRRAPRVEIALPSTGLAIINRGPAN